MPYLSELTPRALVTGLAVGCLVAAANVSVGLKVGMTFGATITAAVLPFAWFRLVRRSLGRPFDPKENMIATTAGSAAGSMYNVAGVISFVPALRMAGRELSFTELVLWTLATGFLGVLFAVPLRRQMIIVERLRYPSGTAAAETITAMHAAGDDALLKAKALLVAAALSAGLKILLAFKPLGWSRFEELSFDDLGLAAVGVGVGGVTFAALRIGVSLSPMLLGAGILVGRKTGWSLALGAALAWGVAAPAAFALGLVSAPTPAGLFGAAQRWLVWPGVAGMVVAGLTGLALQYRTLGRAVTSLRRSAATAADDSPDPMSASTWLALLALAAGATVLLAQVLFAMRWWLGLVAVLLSFLMAVIAVRATAETDLNPVGPMAKVTQLVYGALDPGTMTTNLMAAGITAAGASQAGDLMHDLKAGHLLQVSARRQLAAQAAGVLVGAPVVVGAYTLLANAYPIPGDVFTAPAVQSWYAVARVLSVGVEALPQGTLPAALLAAGCAAITTLLGRVPAVAPYLPSPVAASIAFLVPASVALTLALGALTLGVAHRLRPALCDQVAASVAAGLIAGEGVMLVVIALLSLAGASWL